MDETVRDGRRPTPYVSFHTFLTLIEDLKTNGLPPVLDRSAFKRFSGGVATQLISALKALDLIDGSNRPTPKLARLKETFGTDAFGSELRTILDGAFGFLAEMDLRTATPGMFAEAFRDATGAQEEVLRKCRTFFLHAAKHVGIEIGPRLTAGVQVRRAIGGGGKRPPGAKRTERNEAPTPENDPPAPQQRSPIASFDDRLLEKFPEFNPAWPPEQQAAWFSAFRDLLGLRKEAAK